MARSWPCPAPLQHVADAQGFGLFQITETFRLFLLYLLALCVFIKLTEVTGGSEVQMDVR